MIGKSRCLPLLTLLTACGGAVAGAQEPTPSGGADLARVHMYEVAAEQVAGLPQETGFVEVSGMGSVAVSPDRAVVTFAVETRDDAAGPAAANNAEAMDAVLSALRAAGLSGLVLETYGYSLQPEYSTIMEGTRRVRVIEGYTALNNVRAGLLGVDGVGQVIDVAIGAGANRVSGLDFVASNTDEARREALTKAVEQAREQAATMAAALGRELGPALEVRGGAAEARPRGDRSLMRAEAAQVATPIEAADQLVTATVTIKFALGSPRGGG